MSEASIDAKQVGFSLVALALGAGILFVAGLHLGQDMDMGRGESARPGVQGALGQQAAPASGPRGGSEFSFFSDLRSPDQGPKPRAMPVPEGNANQDASPRERRRDLEGRGVRARVLTREARQEEPRGGAPALAPPALAGRAPAAEAPSPAPVPAELVGQRRLLREGADREPEARPAGRGFTVRAGSFSEYSDAFEVVQRLRAKGHQAHVILINSGEEERSYQVRVGRYADREAAQEAQRKLQGEGEPASVVGL